MSRCVRGSAHCLRRSSTKSRWRGPRSRSTTLARCTSPRHSGSGPNRFSRSPTGSGQCGNAPGRLAGLAARRCGSRADRARPVSAPLAHAQLPHRRRRERRDGVDRVLSWDRPDMGPRERRAAVRAVEGCDVRNRNRIASPSARRGAPSPSLARPACLERRAAQGLHAVPSGRPSLRAQARDGMGWSSWTALADSGCA